MPFGTTHTGLRALAKYATQSFFSRLQVDGEEHVPAEGEGPVLAVANHWNSAVDPAILSCFFPHNRKLHYWAKSTLFKPGFAKTILLDAGNIPVDRRTKDNQKLFAYTFDVLKWGECVAIFPEGGSYTIPGMLGFKDGASWAALEYAKNIRETGKALSTGGEVPGEPKDVTICIAGITYTDKSKYRSSAVMQFGPSISVEPYVAEFYEDPKAAVKKLTKAIQDALTKVTVNAPDWDTLNAATMARKILWVDDRSLPLSSLRDISQTLVDLFSPASLAVSPSLTSLRTLLLAYQSSLRTTHLTHFSLTGVPLPATLDPSIPHPLPTRFRVAAGLLLSTFSSLIRLPFFIVPLVFHLPIYLIGRYSLRFSDLEEDLAQNKIALGLIIGILTYPAMFIAAWAVLFLTPLGGVLAFGFVWLFAVYHNSIIDDNYGAAKRLTASWRVLVGVWAPRAKSEAVAALHVFGITEKLEGENEIRRVLRLRLEASRELMGWLIEREGREEEGEVVRRLVGWGARISRPKGVRAGAVKIE